MLLTAHTDYTSDHPRPTIALAMGSFAAYALEKKLAADPSRFGKGAPEGIIAFSGADLVAFTRDGSRVLVSDAAGLVVIDPGLPPMTVPIHLIWHETRRADAGHRIQVPVLDFGSAVVLLLLGLEFGLDRVTGDSSKRQLVMLAGIYVMVATSLNLYPKTTIDIIGHADSDGSDQMNLDLSRRRAQSVANYLSGQKVARLANRSDDILLNRRHLGTRLVDRPNVVIGLIERPGLLEEVSHPLSPEKHGILCGEIHQKLL